LTDKNTINKSKQINALMPNLVHSLDSSALFLLYNTFKNSARTTEMVNFYSVHDCFGISATKVDLLINLLRNVYIELYSDNKYIENFDKDVIEYIINFLSNDEKKAYYDEDNRLIYNNIGTIKIELPKLPTNIDVLNKDKVKYYNKLKKSILLVN